MSTPPSAITKASEQHLPADERRQVIPGDIIGDDPVELRPVRRMSATSKPSMPGIKGGQDRSGAEIEQDADRLVLGFLLAVVFGIGLFVGNQIVSAATAFGAEYLSCP